jgi:cystathionine gamma-lyase
MTQASYKIDTLLIHAGAEPDPTTGAIMTPIYQTSTFVQEAPGVNKGYGYARAHNPTRTALQTALAAIENGKHALSFASGMAATDAVFSLLSPGDEVLVSNDLYGGTYRLLTKVLSRFGIQSRFVSFSDPSTIAAQIAPNTKMIWIETPTNPLISIVDIEAIAAIGKAHKLITVVDNTFASPYLQNPLNLGADIVVHSATKYLAGHSDVINGAVILNDDDLAEQLRFLVNNLGGVPGPHDCWLVLRGLKTLHLRMQRHCENGAKIAHFLRNHHKVGHVNWAGFEDHPGHEIAKKQMRDFGGMVSFTLKDDSVEAAFKVLKGTQLFSLAKSLGGVESLIGHPATMTHAAIPREERMANGLSDSLIRLSVGVEDADDLIADLNQAIG